MYLCFRPTSPLSRRQGGCVIRFRPSTGVVRHNGFVVHVPVLITVHSDLSVPGHMVRFPDFEVRYQSPLWTFSTSSPYCTRIPLVRPTLRVLSTSHPSFRSSFPPGARSSVFYPMLWRYRQDIFCRPLLIPSLFQFRLLFPHFTWPGPVTVLQFLTSSSLCHSTKTKTKPIIRIPPGFCTLIVRSLLPSIQVWSVPTQLQTPCPFPDTGQFFTYIPIFWSFIEKEPTLMSIPSVVVCPLAILVYHCGFLSWFFLLVSVITLGPLYLKISRSLWPSAMYYNVPCGRKRPSGRRLRVHTPRRVNPFCFPQSERGGWDRPPGVSPLNPDRLVCEGRSPD